MYKAIDLQRSKEKSYFRSIIATGYFKNYRINHFEFGILKRIK
jgi:hypothetical protein